MNNNENLTLVRIIGLVLLFSIFLQIILGAWVRLTGSGMSCPDWPLCYGYIFPTPNKISNIPNVDYTYFQIFWGRIWGWFGDGFGMVWGYFRDDFGPTLKNRKIESSELKD